MRRLVLVTTARPAYELTASPPPGRHACPRYAAICLLHDVIMPGFGFVIALAAHGPLNALISAA